MAFLLVILAVAVGGVVIGWSWWRVAQQKKAAASWPHVSGRITRSEIKQSRGTQGDSEYMPDIHYSYTVNGTGFSGTRVRHGLMKLDLKGAEAMRGRYPEGSAVEVHYNPDKPGDSVLETGAFQ